MLEDLIIALVLTILLFPCAYGAVVVYDRMNPESPYRLLWVLLSIPASIGVGAIAGVSKGWLFVLPGTVFGFSLMMVLIAVVEQMKQAQLTMIRNVAGVRQPWLYGEPANWTITDVADSDQPSSSVAAVDFSNRRVGRRRRSGGIDKRGC